MTTPPGLITLALACLPPAAWADNCDAILDGIASRVRAGGLAPTSLVVVDAGAVKSGRVVGSCANGTRRIVLLPADRPAAAAAAGQASAASAAPSDGIPTECKDGTIVIGPDCNNPRAARMTGSEIAKRVQAGTR